MRKEILGSCPICNGSLHAMELGCKACCVTIRGEFELSPFNLLTKDELRFVEIFIRTQGNFREVQSELGVSYPTVKKQLESVIRSLGYDVKSEPEAAPEDLDVLGQLKNKEISLEEAISRLKAGRKTQ